MSSTVKNPKVLAATLLRLERTGRYGEALAEVSPVWADTSEVPELQSLSSNDAAELLLRCGALVGFLGYNNQVQNAQDRSRNLLTQARERFLELNLVEKITECENYMALTYWRTGELEEAQTWIDSALQREVLPESFVKAQAFIIESKIVFAKGNYAQLFKKFTELEPVMLRLGDSGLLGDFYNHFGLAAKNLGDKELARIYLELAAHHHMLSGHRMFYGTVQNNLAQLLRTEGDYGKALQVIDNATAVFQEINDDVRVGFSLDTKAGIYLDQGNVEEALITIDRALEILSAGENAAYIVETLRTKIRIVLTKGDFLNATLALSEAVQIAKTNISEEAARKIVREFETEIGYKNTTGAIKSPSNAGAIKLSLPPSIAHYENYEIVRIRNSHLETIGLKKGSLAIVVDEEVTRGDLAAIMQIEDGSISCGYFDLDFGIICLEGIDSEPQLHDVDEVKILGKIVGYCGGDYDTDGKMIVKPI